MVRRTDGKSARTHLWNLSTREEERIVPHVCALRKRNSQMPNSVCWSLSIPRSISTSPRPRRRYLVPVFGVFFVVVLRGGYMQLPLWGAALTLMEARWAGWARSQGSSPNAATPFVVPTKTLPFTIVGVMNLFPEPN